MVQNFSGILQNKKQSNRFNSVTLENRKLSADKNTFSKKAEKKTKEPCSLQKIVRFYEKNLKMFRKQKKKSAKLWLPDFGYLVIPRCCIMQVLRHQAVCTEHHISRVIFGKTKSPPLD